MRESIFLKLDSLKEHDHICYLYSNDVEELEMGANFIMCGIKEKEKCFYISDRPHPKELMYRLTGNGVNGDRVKYFEEILTSGEQSGGMEDPYSFVRFLRSTIEAGLEEGSRARVLKSIVGFPYTHLLWREALLDKFCSERPLILMCQFDSTGISAEDVISLFKTHRIIVLENTVYDSPFYTRPDRIISRLNVRHNTRISLTPRERAILRHIANGYSNSDTAKALSISIKTVEAHRTHIMKKLNISKSVNLMKFAIRNRIV